MYLLITCLAELSNHYTNKPVKKGDNMKVRIKETERIVNISELEKDIRSAQLQIIDIKKAVENNASASEIAEMLNGVQKQLSECENFEFVIEQRKVIVRR